MNTTAAFDDLIFIEDELGVTLNDLTASELKILAKTCSELALMPYKERRDLFTKVNEIDEGILFEE